MTSTDRRQDLVVIRNVHAGRKAGIPTGGISTEDLRRLLRRHGLKAETIETASEDEAIAAVRASLARGCETIVAAGGDGTFGLVARQLAGTSAVLGILPLGSFMNVARSLGIPRDLERAAEILAAGHRRRIDLGEARGNGRPETSSEGQISAERGESDERGASAERGVDDEGGGKLFLEAAMVGLTAELFGEAHELDKGHYRSIFAIIATLARYRPARFTIRLDERVVRTRALMVVVANTPYTGANMTFAPEARLDDGQFDVRVYRHFSKWEIVRHLVSIMLGRRGYSFKVASYRTTRVLVETATPRPCRADDADVGLTPLVCVVRPRALTVIVPEHPPPGGLPSTG